MREATREIAGGVSFLLAITEYLRVQTRHPHHRLAYRMFRGLREDAKDIKEPKYYLDFLLLDQQIKRAHPQLGLSVIASGSNALVRIRLRHRVYGIRPRCAPAHQARPTY